MSVAVAVPRANTNSDADTCDANTADTNTADSTHTSASRRPSYSSDATSNATRHASDATSNATRYSSDAPGDPACHPSNCTSDATCHPSDASSSSKRNATRKKRTHHQRLDKRRHVYLLCSSTLACNGTITTSIQFPR